MEPIHLTINVRDANNTYLARAVKSINASKAGLPGRQGTATRGEEGAVEALLRHATPPLQLLEVKSIERPGATHRDPVLYHITAQVINP